MLSGSSRARPAEQARSSAFLRSEHQRSFRGGAGPTDGERWIEQQVKGNLAAVMADVPVSVKFARDVSHERSDFGHALMDEHDA